MLTPWTYSFLITYVPLSVQAAMPKLIRKSGYFDLFGFDFMMSTCPDREGRLLLLEVNTNPALSLGTRK